MTRFMKKRALSVFLSALVLISFSRSDAATSDEAAAIVAIKKMGGKITVDEARPGKPVIKVVMAMKTVTDADLIQVAAFSQLQSLQLRTSRVTDAGLIHLQGLTQLQVLHLGNTQVTDAGMPALQGLTNLKELDFTGDKITDAGIAALKGLT